jgi:hypothetical protein
MLESKRGDIVRSAVLQVNTAIEDLLDQHIIYALAADPFAAIQQHIAQQVQS